MYVHLGQDYVLNSDEIIGVFDLDNTSTSKKTREFLAFAQQNKAVFSLSEDIPKSFIIADGVAETIYLSSLATSVLKKRVEKPQY